MAAPAAMMDLQMAIRRNAEDLKSELADLDRWEDELAKKEEARKSRVVTEPELPPVRGTAPAQATEPAKPKVDPIKVAKDEGNEFFRLLKFEEAVRAYTRGINHDPQGSATHVLYANRAMCYIKLQMWDLAEKDATVCTQMNRTFAKAWYRRAIARRAMGKLKDARSDLETVLVLSPGDADAQRELKAVTSQLVEAEQKTPTSSSQQKPKRKKLVIQEVDDEDEETTPVARPANDAVERDRRERQEKDLAAAREAERQRAEARAVEAAKEEKRRADARRTHSRVEVLDDEDEADTPQAKPAAAAASPAEQTSESASKRPVHVDPAPRRLPNAGQLSELQAPKTFTEFENTFSDIMKKEPSALSRYLSLIPVVKWKTVFGSNMTPEILVEIFKALRTGANLEVQVQVLCGLATVNRLSEVIMFMDDDDQNSAKSFIDDVRSRAGTSAESDGIAKLLTLF